MLTGAHIRHRAMPAIGKQGDLFPQVTFGSVSGTVFFICIVLLIFIFLFQHMNTLLTVILTLVADEPTKKHCFHYF